MLYRCMARKQDRGVGNCQKNEDSPVKGYRKPFFGSYQVTACDNCSENPNFFP